MFSYYRWQTDSFWPVRLGAPVMIFFKMFPFLKWQVVFLEWPFEVQQYLDLKIISGICTQVIVLTMNSSENFGKRNLDVLLDLNHNQHDLHICLHNSKHGLTIRQTFPLHHLPNDLLRKCIYQPAVGQSPWRECSIPSLTPLSWEWHIMCTWLFMLQPMPSTAFSPAPTETVLLETTAPPAPLQNTSNPER